MTAYEVWARRDGSDMILVSSDNPQRAKLTQGMRRIKVIQRDSWDEASMEFQRMLDEGEL